MLDFKANSDDLLVIRVLCDDECDDIIHFTWTMYVFDEAGRATEVFVTGDRLSLGKVEQYRGNRNSTL